MPRVEQPTNARVLVFRTAGTNCDQETVHAFRLVKADVDLRHVSDLCAHPLALRDYHIAVFPGGFSYGDDLSAGILFANEVRRWLAEEFRRFVKADKLVLGICNGFQVLVRSGMLPGWRMFSPDPAVTLTRNDSNRFECRWVNLATDSRVTPFAHDVADRFDLPVAHAEGKVEVRDRKTLRKLIERGQVVFRYATPRFDDEPESDEPRPDAKLAGQAPYPFNPNGSSDNIAAICDPSGLILGMMPHPERNVDPTHHPLYTRRRPTEPGAGYAIFKSAVAHVREHHLGIKRPAPAAT
ncbi:MAG: phosphoribosylformylglycinamidine synthase I [Planctomycetes bacterium]|nr:phosphoribosylformylglycinamidine synthase I [Planctomycetota bacterium]